MGLNINKVRQSGFTIVELLIVVVVIAILAAITIVSYNGITTQANDSAAKAAASTFQKKAELYYSRHDVYPTSLANLSDNAEEPYYLASGVQFGATPLLDKDNGKDTVRAVSCGAGTGLRIYHWSFSDNSESTPIVVGTGCS